MSEAVALPPVPVGRIKSFGPMGPKYEVGHPVRQLDDGEWMVEITMVEIGEKSEYLRSHMLADPEGQ